MVKKTRTQDWGFPRWRGYGSASEAVKVRLCDRHGCTDPGDRPAPKRPNHPERWWFCERHAAEYNANWNYFEGLSDEEAKARESREQADFSGFKTASHYGWGGPGDGSRSRDELHALEALGLDEESDFEAAKVAWRKLAKENHPDIKPGDAKAAVKFQAVQAAYEVLRSAEERRMALGK
jgi:hypothetical protein